MGHLQSSSDRVSGMKRVGLGLLTSALAAAAFVPFADAPLAHAADLPVPGPAPVNYFHPALYDWTGIYFGGNIGAAFMQDTASQTGSPVIPIIGSFNNSPVGAIGGGQVGANWEFAPWVVGIEGAWSGAVSMSQTTMVSTTPATATNETLQNNLFWLASVTGRVGYAHDDLLFYGKGGGAWESVKYLQTVGGNGAAGLQSTINDTRTGFTVGAGIEYGLTENFSAKLEYDFYDFGSKTYNLAFTPLSISSQVHVVLAGVNYRFTWGGGRP
jgi:outer membrane immunogenic protein